jgi:hypothetical protein
MAVKMKAEGAFDVKLSPQAADAYGDGLTFGRMTVASNTGGPRRPARGRC